METQEEPNVEYVQPPSGRVVLKQILTLGLGDYFRRLGKQREIIKETFTSFSYPKKWMFMFWSGIRTAHKEGSISELSQREINDLNAVISQSLDRELVRLSEDPFSSSLHEVVLAHGQQNEGPGILITDLSEFPDSASSRILGIALFALYSFSRNDLVESAIVMGNRSMIDTIRAYRNTLEVLLEISDSSIDATTAELGRFTVDYLDRRLALGVERRPRKED